MITKGYVVSKSKENSNKYFVRIPIFEPAGIGLTSSNLNTSISECTLCYNPGTYDGLKPGDCVFVSFEDNQYSKPIILGKLFVDIESESSAFQYNTDLKVTHKATLPVDTTIGNVPFDNILNYFNSIDTAINKLSTVRDINVRSIQFETENQDAGKVYFNDEEGVLQTTLSPNVTMAIGIDTVLKVYNDTPEDMYDGQVVYKAANIGNDKAVALSIADSRYIANSTLGVVTEPIPSYSHGFILRRGYVGSLIIDPAIYNLNDTLYLSPTVPGAFTKEKPVAPYFVTKIGHVSKVSSDGSTPDGQIYVEIEITPISTDISYDHSDSLLEAQTVKGALDELSLGKVDVGALSSNITLYPTSVNSTIPGYYRMVSTTADGDYDSTAFNFSTGPITTSNQLIASLVADENLFVGNPGIISVTTIGNIRKTAGNTNQYAEFFFRIYHRNAAGVENLIGTSGTTGAVNPGDLNTYYQFSSNADLSNGAFLSTDRIVIKYYANMIGNVGSVYEFQLGGSTPVRTLLPVPVSVIPTPLASAIITNVSTFGGILSSFDTNVQTALNTIDDHNHDTRYLGISTVATDTVLGSVKIGDNITITDGKISVSAPYSLPTATDTILGGVKIGDNISINNGTISVAAPYLHPNHSGDVTSVGDGATTIVAGAVTLSKMANLAANTIIGNNTASAAVPKALTAAQVRTLINVEDGANKYILPYATQTAKGGVRAYVSGTTLYIYLTD